MDGVTLTPLKIISHPSGDVLHGIKSSEGSFTGFGEAYFSTVNQGDIKGWKKHSKMTLNLVVPKGEIQFVIFDDRDKSTTQGKFMSVSLSLQNYQRLNRHILFYLEIYLMQVLYLFILPSLNMHLKMNMRRVIYI